jgi:hypothetical protein
MFLMYLRLSYALFICFFLSNSVTSQILSFEDKVAKSPSKENQEVGPQTDGLVKSLTLEESIIPNSWIFQLKEKPLLSYNQDVKMLFKTSRNEGISTQKQLQSMLTSHRKKLEKQQDSFIRYAKNNNLIEETSKQLIGISNAIVVSASESDMQALKQHPDVKSVHQNRRYQPTLSQSIPAIKADKVWLLKDAHDNYNTGLGVKIAILDTGINYTHPDLGGCFGEGCKVAGGYDVYNDDDDPIEDEEAYKFLGHGTHVAGIAAANGKVVGVAPDAMLYAYKVCGVDLCSTINILRGLELAANPDQDSTTNDKVDVINISLGSRFGELDEPIATAINQLVDLGIVIIVASGNDGDFASIGGIASAQKAITVASHNLQSSTATPISDFSSQGPVKNATYLKPEITAPGESISSTCVTNSNRIDAYCNFSGTSMASPHVAGVAALILQANPDYTSQQIKSAIINNASLFDNISSAIQGAGLVNALASIESEITVSPSIVYFGDIDHENEFWEKEATLTISNNGGIKKTFDLDFLDNAPIGISWNLQNTSQIEVEAGESIDVVIKLSVNTSVFDVFAFKNLSIDNSLTVSNGDQQIHVPLIFTKMMTFEIDQTVHADDVTFFNQLYGEYHDRGSIYNEFYLPIGTYNLIATLEESHTSYILFGEGLTLDSLRGYTFDFAQAVHQMSISSITNMEGNEIDLSQISISNTLEYRHAEAKYHDFFGNTDNDPSEHLNINLAHKTLYFSDVSEAFTFRLAMSAIPWVNPIDNKSEIYTYNDKFMGIDKNRNYHLEAKTMLSQTFSIVSPKLVEQSYPIAGYSFDSLDFLDFSSTNWSKYSGWRAFAEPLDLNGGKLLFNKPYEVRIFGNLQGGSDDDYLKSFDFGISSESGSNYTEIMSGSFFGNSNKMVTFGKNNIGVGSPVPPFSFNLGGSSIIDGSFSNINVSPYLTQNSYFGISRTRNYFNSLSRNKKSSGKYYCDSDEAVIHEDSAIGAAFVHCSQYIIENRYATNLYDANFENETYVKLSRPNEEHQKPIKGPSLEHTFITNEGKIVAWPTKKETLFNTLFSSETQIDNVSIEVKIDGDWQPLEVTKELHDENRDKYSTILPLPEKARVAHMRITATDPVGNITQLTQVGLMFLGIDQSTMLIDDFDNDGQPDYKDSDDDNDGVEDLHDEFVLDASESVDSDVDGIGNNADTDDDADGVEDGSDAFPLDSSETVDTDNDGTGNNTDSDDDGDDVNDSEDIFPLDKSESLDTDGDGIGNNADTDDDADGVEDDNDAFPLDNTETVDTDNDGTGNNADNDDDGDGVSDSSDAFPLDASRSLAPSSSSNNAGSSGGGGGSLSYLYLLTLLAYRLILVKTRHRDKPINRMIK